ncbi:CsiV family protein [Pseudomonas aeruginosa]
MRLFRCLALLLSLAAPAAFAGGPYQVELVVFRQAGDAVPSSQPAPDDWATGAQPLASDALRATALDNQLAKLSQDNGYTVLLHKAWRQDIGETPVKIALSEGQEQDHHFPVEGTLTLSQVRFVDMEADFWVNRFGDDGFLAGSQHIRQGTRLKNGELTYLDHPSLGILIKVVPVGARPAAPNPMEMEEQQAPAADALPVEGGFDAAPPAQ